MDDPLVVVVTAAITKGICETEKILSVFVF
jgi:hypothetical protein